MNTLQINRLPVDLWRNAADWALSWLYPNICQVCNTNKAGKREGYVCNTCRNEPGALKPVVDPYCQRCGVPFSGEFSGAFVCANCRATKYFFRRARAAVLWTPFIREIIHKYKYNRALWHEPFLADLLISQSASALNEETWDMIVPIPLHASKLRKREFNQAERLSIHLSKATGIPMQTRILQRIAQTQTQTRLNPRERAENVKQAFAFSHKADLVGARIILVDDVLTTGATANACAKVLRQNGADCVDVWTVARGVLE